MAQYGNGKYVENNIELLDCTIGRGTWRNFTGEKTAFNKDGTRGFTIFLPEDLYTAMAEEGWYVKHKEQYAGDEREFQIDVAFSFDMYPPVITMYSADGTSAILNADTVGLLQTADFERVNLVLRPHNYDSNGNKGVKAWLNSMDVWVKPPRRSMSASFNREDDDD